MSNLRIIQLKFWLNAFIPAAVYNKDGSLYTEPLPGHPGQTTIPGPVPGNDCFATDNRSFSSDPGASSRMHSELNLYVNNNVWSTSQSQWCGTTREFDCEDGELEGQTTATTANMKFSDPVSATLKVNGWMRKLLNIRRSGKILRCTADLSAAQSDPLFTISPDIDYEGKVVCMIVPDESVSIMFSGLVDEFPAFEAYATLNGGLAQSLFQLAPLPGRTPVDLVGKANQTVTGTALWRWPTN